MKKLFVLSLFLVNVCYCLAQSVNGHDYVDMGLSVKWATCNLGANAPNDYGGYYYYSETDNKTRRKESDFKLYVGKKKWKNIPVISGTEYDVVTANWGAPWRLPTENEWLELTLYCQWEWMSINGIMGYKIISKRNGNSIFLPASGNYNSVLNEVLGKGTGAIYLTGETWYYRDNHRKKEFIKEICFKTWNFSSTTRGGDGMMGLSPYPGKYPVRAVCE